MRVAFPEESSSVTVSPERVAAILCIAGFLLRLLFSEPILLNLGLMHDDPMNSGMSGRLHPGTYLICLSFLILLFISPAPHSRAWRLMRENHAAFLLLGFYLLFFLFWLARDPTGIGQIIETHMTAPICAIVLAHARRSDARMAIGIFLTFALVNSLAGIVEALGHFRLLSFHEDWPVLKEIYFRPSALLGHPLTNAMLTSIALFITLGTRLSVWLKALMTSIFITALVAFSGRCALICSLVGLLLLGFYYARQGFGTNRMALRHHFFLCALALALPLMMLGGVYLLIYSHMGERIAAMIHFEDDGAQSRLLAFSALHYLKPEEWWLGISSDRAVEITYRMNLSLPLTDIENPWILMFMYCGLLFFPIWLAIFFYFIATLLKNMPPALQVAVIVYFIIASTSNSFGRKDILLATVVAAVTCAWRPSASDYPANYTHIGF